MKTLRDDIDAALSQADRLVDTHPDLAADLMEAAQIAEDYLVKSERHTRIIESARERVSRGENPQLVYSEERDRLLGLWLDAVGYGEALVELQAATKQEIG